MQIVEVNDVQASYWVYITTRAPQGSVLGKLLFLVYINDIANAVQFSKVYKFADDTNITSVCSSSESFQNNLSSLCDWFFSNNISIIVDKSSLVNFKQKQEYFNYAGWNKWVFIKYQWIL